MDGSSLLCLALLGYLAWREKAHAAERRSWRAGRGTVASPPSRLKRKRGGARVISPEDDEAFNKAREEREAAAKGED